jgi:hypothetical protein
VRTPTVLSFIALTLSGFAPATAQGRQTHRGYVSRPVFALMAPGGYRGPRSTAVDSRSRARHRRNPAFAGYLTTRTGVTSVVARFRVPAVGCSHRETAISPGAFVLTGPRDRLSFNAANVIVGCYGGVATAQETLVVDDVEFDYARSLQPGDLVVARLTDTPGKQTEVQLQNLTAGHEFVITKSGRGAKSDAQLIGDWGSADGQTGAPLVPPDFERTEFRAISVDEQPLGAHGARGYDMASSSNVLQIATSPLLGPARDSFTCTRRFVQS